MKYPQNPFIDLYVTENISADIFVKVFSPVIFEDANTLALFQPGNVLLIGLQGSGKTALLNLLKPEVIIAYRKANQDWPLPSHCANFISAGINLSKSSAMDFGQRKIDCANSGDELRYAMYFADFLNFWIVEDLLRSIELLYQAAHCEIREGLNIDASEKKLDQFAIQLASQSCWLGSMNNVKNYKDLKNQLIGRVVDYRNFLNYNSDDLPNSIKQYKTSVGEPISVTVEILKSSGVIPADIPIFIRIDQFEDLMGLENADSQLYRQEYRSVVYKMLGMRDSRLSYRIGSRPYAVQRDFRMLATNSAIEELRNFQVVDIDSILRRSEHSKGLFPKFAEDVFQKRLLQANYELPQNKKQTVLRYVFGKKPDPDQRAKNYAKASTSGVVSIDDVWPEEVKKALLGLAKENPLSAKLGEAWVRQQNNNLSKLALTVSAPWQGLDKRWWRKERTEIALLQIAASRKQRMNWFGETDILALSGGNILVFLSICQLIWAEHLRANEISSDQLPLIHNQVLQDLGIQQASEYWYRKLRADPNGGDDRYRFVKEMAEELRIKLREDKKMSYPGANGFSLSQRDLEKTPEISEFLDSCTAYGVLTTNKHTPKTSSLGISQKWYLFPILSPYFQLPVVHTKEPLYVKPDHVQAWLIKADVLIKNQRPKSLKINQNSKNDLDASGQLSLFKIPTKK